MSAGLGIETDFLGIAHLALKETDRLVALENELKKINVSFNHQNNIFTISPSGNLPQENSPISFQTYNDHRMAMSLAPLCLKLGKINIDEPEVVVKSFPSYWDELKKLGFILE